MYLSTYSFIDIVILPQQLHLHNYDVVYTSACTYIACMVAGAGRLGSLVQAGMGTRLVDVQETPTLQSALHTPKHSPLQFYHFSFPQNSIANISRLL